MCLIMINVCIILWFFLNVQVQGMFDIFVICHSVFNSFLCRYVVTCCVHVRKCGNVRYFTDWIVVFVLTVFFNY